MLVWGSFVTAKAEPADLDYSIVVSVGHRWAQGAEPHRRFLAPFEAHMHYGIDRGFLAVYDYPPVSCAESLDFMCYDRHRRPCGIVEISLRGEVAGES